jgi:hypothetical protein
MGGVCVVNGWVGVIVSYLESPPSRRMYMSKERTSGAWKSSPEKRRHIMRYPKPWIRVLGTVTLPPGCCSRVRVARRGACVGGSAGAHEATAHGVFASGATRMRTHLGPNPGEEGVAVEVARERALVEHYLLAMCVGGWVDVWVGVRVCGCGCVWVFVCGWVRGCVVERGFLYSGARG